VKKTVPNINCVTENEYFFDDNNSSKSAIYH